MKSCWITNFANGQKVLVSDDDRSRLIIGQVDFAQITSEEHWFDEKKAMEKNPDAIVVRVKGL